jgi:hypothetical protein
LIDNKERDGKEFQEITNDKVTADLLDDAKAGNYNLAVANERPII